MLALATFIILLLLSLIVVRVATVALTLTGLSSEIARFQARSAWTGTGFTTSESEGMLAHPVRRRIVSWLMLIRNAGLVTAISTLVLSFADARGSEAGWQRLAILLGFLVLLFIVAQSKIVERQMWKLFQRLLERYTDLEARDYAGLLHLGHDYSVAELAVSEGDWLADRTLAELDLPDEGVLVLGIERANGDFVGAPRGSVRVAPHDTLILYARKDMIRDLDIRPAGEEGSRAHHQAKRTERRRQKAVEREERQREGKEPAKKDDRDTRTKR